MQNLGVSGEDLISKYLKQTLALPFHKKARFPALSTLVKCGGIFFEYPQFLIIFRDKTKNDIMIYPSIISKPNYLLLNKKDFNEKLDTTKSRQRKGFQVFMTTTKLLPYK